MIKNQSSHDHHKCPKIANEKKIVLSRLPQTTKLETVKNQFF